MGWFDRPEYGPNVGLIEEIYLKYLDDPDSVSPAWREFFTLHDPELGDEELRIAPDDEAAAPPDAAPDAAPGRTTGATSRAPSEATSRGTSRGTSHGTTDAASEATSRATSRATTDGHPDGRAAAAAAPPSRPEEAEPATEGEREPAPKEAPEEQLTRLRGAGARIVEAMETSLAVPTATSVRTIPARLLEVNRNILNGHLRRHRGGKVSFTHLIGYAVVKALAAMPALRSTYAEADGKPAVVRHEHVNLGLAVDVKRGDGRTLLVPNIKRADTLDFAEFWRAYEQLIRKVRDGKLSVEDFAGTTVTITNPGTIGTVSSVPRLMAGQAAIIGVGAITYPAEFQGADPARLADMGVGKVLSVTSTYDHRVIQGAESGELLALIHRLLLGEDGFYDDVFAAMGVPYVPARWHEDANPADRLAAIEKQQRVLSLINMYRVRGHLLADVDPLGIKPVTMPRELDPFHYGFSIWDLDRTFPTGGLAGTRELKLGRLLGVLRDAYCRTATVEYMHIPEPDEKRWIQERMEVPPSNLDGEDRAQILHKLTEAEAFERFLHNKYTGHKRFSLEGAETLIPMLDALLDGAAGAGMEEVVIGMAHRGRLNVLANTIGKSYEEIFHEFEGNYDPVNPEGTGDVKYHLGASGKHTARDGGEIKVSVASNPSHLEAVNPVVEGIVRAKQDLLGRPKDLPVLPVLIHGDAAFAGQGVVAETLNLSQLAGYRTGGTVHVVVNNQLGFTTSPDYGRSSPYATDVAKMIQAPIWHVNGDDPEACVRVMRQAFEFRRAFGKDVVIDMWCYRRWGHNETDEPAFTQPVMYARIKGRPSVRKLYVQELVERGDLSVEDAEKTLEAFRARLQRAFDEHTDDGRPRQLPKVERATPAKLEDPQVETAVELPVLKEVARQLAVVPDGFQVHPKLIKWVQQRTDAVATDARAVDWSLAEALAFGALVLDGGTVRLTGQDTRRGTFSHRHSDLVDQRTGDRYMPLAHLTRPDGTPAPGRAQIYDSLLSEFACVGFEYGYTIGDPSALVLWEAQFGDFVNGAQIIIDQFVTSAEDKWGQRSGLVLLLPHGYEGQGPEHSSSRIERFLQLAAHDNIQVAVPSTAGQYFHLLRRQALRALRKPLVVATPKSLLRLPAARSTAAELAGGRFDEVIDDPALADDGDGQGRTGVQRVLLCSGKVYHDLARRRDEAGVEGVALVRVEQLYPFPEAALRTVLHRYDGAEVVWAQEEPENMGGWRFMKLVAERQLGLDLVPVTRDEAAAPAAGSPTIHEQEQRALVDRALGVKG
jgi:2-oxoglutarate dehydrogenase E1 component